VTDRAYQMEHEGRDVIHLGVGDPDLDTPPAIVNAAKAALESGRTHYSPIPGEALLRRAIANVYLRDYDLKIEVDQITVFPGAQSALFATLQCLAGPGDEVILLEPFYATYEGVVRASGANVIAVPLSAENKFQLDIDRIKAAITQKTRVIVANSPGNPSGAVFCQGSWQSLLEVCLDAGIWLVSDEVYANFVFDDVHFSPLALPTAAQNVVVISSLSKSHAMTGWRIGWSISPVALASHLANLSQCLLFGVSQFTQDAAAFALQNSHEAAAEMRTIFRRRRNLFCDALENTKGLQVHRPDGGMFTMIDVSGLKMDGEIFANRLLDQSGVAVVPGFAFGDSVHNFVRVGYLQNEQALADAANRIKKFVANL